MKPGSGKWEFGEAGFLVASRGYLQLEMERWIETVLQSVKHDAKCKWLLTGLFQGVVSEHLDALLKENIPKHPVVLSPSQATLIGKLPKSYVSTLHTHCKFIPPTSSQYLSFSLFTLGLRPRDCMQAKQALPAKLFPPGPSINSFLFFFSLNENKNIHLF